MSDSVRPHRRQPTKLPRPWDSLGKNTGVSCHFLLQCRKMKSESEVTQLCRTLRDPMDCRPTRLLRPWDFSGKSAGVGCHCLLQYAPLQRPNYYGGYQKGSLTKWKSQSSNRIIISKSDQVVNALVWIPKWENWEP